MATATAEKVTPIEEGKGLVQFGKALVKFDIQEQVLQDLEEATRLEITDAASEKVVRKHRQNAKSIQVRIEKTRLQLNRDFKEKTDAAAALIAPRVTAAYDKLDEKVKVVESEREARKAEKEEAERLRLGKIQWRMDGLEYDCNAGLEYNLPYPDIAHCLNTLHDIKISAVDFQEQTEKAEQMLAEAIKKTECAYTDRVDWEEQQTKLAEEKAKQEAEVKRLAEEKAEFEAEQKRVTAEKIRKDNLQSLIDGLKAETVISANLPSADLRRHLAKLENRIIHPEIFEERAEEAKKIVELASIEINQYIELAGKAEAEAERLRKEREALEKEKAKAAHAAVVAEREIYWEVAHEENAEFDYLRDWVLAIEENQARRAAYEATEKAKAEAAARAELIGPDIKTTQKIANTLTEYLNNFPSEFDTEEAANLTTRMISDLLIRVESYRVAGAALK